MDHPEQRPQPLRALSGESRPGLRDALLGPVDDAARALLGVLLVRDGPSGPRIARIVEVEAYGGPEDLASHARFGRTARNRAMFEAAGRAYVYGVYGMHTCLNVVAGPAGWAAAILVRTVEPIAGVEAIRSARVERAVVTRRRDGADPAGARERLARVPATRLTTGPANVAAGFGITRADDGSDLLDAAGTLRLVLPDEPAATPGGPDAPAALEVASGPRVGVAYAGPVWADRPWRFWVAGSPALGTPPRARAGRPRAVR